jgi:hypothetical protein
MTTYEHQTKLYKANTSKVWNVSFYLLQEWKRACKELQLLKFKSIWKSLKL